jgi:hypothetical protein
MAGGMKFPLVLLILISAAGLCRADFVIIQKVDSLGQSGQMTIMVNGDKIRADISPQISTITDARTGQVTTLMHEQKRYMVISKGMFEQMANVAMQGSTPPATQPAPKATGKTDKINGYNAAEYTFSIGTIKGSYWMSTEFPNAKAVGDALLKFQKGGLANLAKSFAPDLTALPGVPVKTVVEFNGQTTETDLVSAKEQAVDPAEYQVPAAYTEMKMPAMPPPQ